MSALELALANIKAQNGLHLAPAAAVKMCAGLDLAKITSGELFTRALHANFSECTEPGMLQRDLGSQQLTTVRSTVTLQIQSSRDATQPLRPCADMEPEEAMLGAVNQRNSNQRLLRLTLSDGHVEIPAVELKTLKAFKGIPIPGEKVVVKEGSDVRNGMIILSDDKVQHLGGSVEQLRQEFLFRKGRLGAAYQHVAGLEGAPKFAPLRAISSSNATQAARHLPVRISGAPSNRSPAEPFRGSSERSRAREGTSRGDSDRGRGHQGRAGERGGGERGRGGNTRGRGHYERGGNPRHVDPAERSLAPNRTPPEAVPQFNDEDFPSLGEW